MLSFNTDFSYFVNPGATNTGVLYSRFKAIKTMNKNIIGQLDAVLESLSDESSKHAIELSGVIGFPYTGISTDRIFLIMGELIKKEYVVSCGSGSYKITFTGLLLNESGGYALMIAKDRILEEQLKSVQNSQTLLLLAASLISGFALAWDFLKWYLSVSDTQYDTLPWDLISRILSVF